MAGRPFYRFNEVSFEDYEKIALTLLIDAQLILQFGPSEQTCYEVMLAVLPLPLS